MTVGPRFEHHAVVSGIGRSDIGRRLNRDPLELTAQACMAAMADAGLRPEDIDGLSTFPGASTGMSLSPGFTGAGVYDVQRMLGLSLSWHTGGDEVPGQLGSVINACMAVATGLARHVLCFRTVWEATGQGTAGRASVVTGRGTAHERVRVEPARQWTAPFGATALNRYALMTQRHFDRYGTTREQLGQVALIDRHYAALNPAAVYRDPMTLQDYLGGRMISSPLCVFDCDVPVDGSIAVVVSEILTAPDLRKDPVHVEAVGSALGYEGSANMLWQRTDLRPADVDIAEIYDGFSILTLLWLEALGFCSKGEGGVFLSDSSRFLTGGALPMNTGGGQLSAGRVHGYVHFYEACLQLWDEGDERQVVGNPEVAVVTAGASQFAGCLLLTRHR